MIRFAGLVGVTSLLAALPAPAPDDVDELVRAMMAEYDIPGVAVAVTRGGDVVKLAGYGVSSVELHVPVTPDTVFPLASTTKSFGGIAIERRDDLAAYALGRQLVEEFPENPTALNWIAWTIVAADDLVRRDLDLALEAATRANDVTDRSHAAVLDTLARVHFERGELDEALRWQERAVTFAGDDETGQEIRARLETYRAERHEEPGHPGEGSESGPGG